MSSNRTYTKQEISRILNKASEIQTKKDLFGEDQHLTEEELIHIAEEVGIDRLSLKEAIQRSDFEHFDAGYNWLKATSRIQTIASIDGEFTDEEWEEIVQEIRRITGGIGKINKVGKSFEWEQRKNDIGYTHFSFTPQKGKTKLQMVSSWGALKMIINIMAFMFGSLILLITFKEISSKQIGMLMAPLGGLGGLAMARFFLKTHYNRQKEKVIDIKNAVANKIKSFGQAKTPEDTIEIEDAEVYRDDKHHSDDKSNLRS
ncbi:MAG: hypothetical protein FH748_17020 [Balneolaceae bacterium]|nr:hypothetical protein [Balneolaceae bacterium]